MYPSFKLGEKREVIIGLTESYEKNPDKKYPLILSARWRLFILSFPRRIVLWCFLG
jgi:hypothetical protein